ncbi:hypothetical protein [Romboutsia sp. 1001713B170131_170501_G6]|uniref:hypothetical protein n=1 Tax=Romboutsia sp. 1001713B170131_170501_G6 TaxID=2787108 RepID=UPI0018A9A40D|nr:hypothetical protein [Romboutsia sp. 1001713B170131_170501_G6]
MKAFDINVENRAKEISKEVVKEVMKETMDEKYINKMAGEVAERAVYKILNRGKDWRFKNTKLLMRNYKSLKQHILNEKDEIKILYADMDEDYVKVDYMWLESIIKSKGKTIQILKYVDEQLEYLERKYKERKQYERYKAFELLLIEGKSNIEMQREIGCSKNMPNKWTNEVVRELSVLLWGIDAICMHVG